MFQLRERENRMRTEKKKEIFHCNKPSIFEDLAAYRKQKNFDLRIIFLLEEHSYMLLPINTLLVFERNSETENIFHFQDHLLFFTSSKKITISRLVHTFLRNSIFSAKVF